jgi:hypothetical protein
LFFWHEVYAVLTPTWKEVITQQHHGGLFRPIVQSNASYPFSKDKREIQQSEDEGKP